MEMSSIEVIPNREEQNGYDGTEEDLSEKRKRKEFDNINVVVRVKPIQGKRQTVAEKQRERDSSLFPAAGQIQVTDPISNTLKSFTFNVVFEPEATQEDVFAYSGIKRLIDMALEGFACTAFAYGQTGSGKTFTLSGNIFEITHENHKDTNHGKGGTNAHHNHNHSNTHNHNHNHNQNQTHNDDGGNNKEKQVVGLIQLSFAYLFDQIRNRKEKGIYYIVTASFLEIYNEQVLDLLNPSNKSLQVRWSKDKGFYAENLFKVECEDIGDLEGVLQEGSKIRSVRRHEMNDNSSRSHSLLTITLASETQDPEDPQGYIRKEGRLCLVDLAGSEKTKRTHSKGDTFLEANNINRSLLVLGNCISSLACPKRRCGHIPYRDSTLTKLLADSLSGSGMTLMIACVSPAIQDASESISTLRYASRAKKVKTNPVVRMDHRELLILSLKREVRLLRMENNYLRQQLNLGTGFIENASDKGSDKASDRPTSNDSNASPIETDQKRTKDTELDIFKQNLLSKYMHENESLRAENSNLHLQREQLIHDHEKVVRENERLKRRMDTPSDEKLANRGETRRPSIIAFSTVPEANKVDNPKKSTTKLNGHHKSNNKVNEHKATNGDTHASNGLDLEIRGKSAATNPRYRH